MSTTDDTVKIRREIRSDRVEVERAEEELMQAIDKFEYPEACRFAIRLAFEEAVSNAIRHGHAELPEGTPVGLEVDVSSARVDMSVQDQGPGFDPEEIPDPTLEENLSKPTGRGLLLIRAYMSDVTFNERGNRINMRYERPANPEDC